MKTLLYFLAYLSFFFFGVDIYLLFFTEVATSLSYFNVVVTLLVGAGCFALARTT